MCSFNIYKYCMFHQLLATVLVLTTVGGGANFYDNWSTQCSIRTICYNFLFEFVIFIIIIVQCLLAGPFYKKVEKH